MLFFDGKYYVIGDGHREFTLDKVSNQDHYILTLAGIGQELWYNKLTTAKVHIAAGLPLTWVDAQREPFRAYLLQNSHVDFNWRGVDYHVDIIGADVYAQGYSAIVPALKKFTGANILCDIGNGTMNIMAINNRRAVMDQCFTEKYGTYQCMLQAREALTQRFGCTVPAKPPACTRLKSCGSCVGRQRPDERGFPHDAAAGLGQACGKAGGRTSQEATP